MLNRWQRLCLSCFDAEADAEEADCHLQLSRARRYVRAGPATAETEPMMAEAIRYVVVIQRLGEAFVVRLLTHRGDQLHSKRCLTKSQARWLAANWSAMSGGSKVVDDNR